jgi:hypothetical protein
MAFRAGIRKGVSGRVSSISTHSPSVSAGFTTDASLDRPDVDFCSLGNRPLEQFMNPKSNLFHIKKGQFSDLQLNGKNLLAIPLFYSVQDTSYDFVGDGEFVHD